MLAGWFEAPVLVVREFGFHTYSSLWALGPTYRVVYGHRVRSSTYLVGVAFTRHGTASRDGSCLLFEGITTVTLRALKTRVRCPLYGALAYAVVHGYVL